MPTKRGHDTLRDLRFLREAKPGEKSRTPKAKPCKDFRDRGENGASGTPLPGRGRTSADRRRVGVWECGSVSA
jgi:hypothetical protein